jgi:hypothetical protein
MDTIFILLDASLNDDFAYLPVRFLPPCVQRSTPVDRDVSAEHCDVRGLALSYSCGSQKWRLLCRKESAGHAFRQEPAVGNDGSSFEPNATLQRSTEGRSPMSRGLPASEPRFLRNGAHGASWFVWLRAHHGVRWQPEWLRVGRRFPSCAARPSRLPKA